MDSQMLALVPQPGTWLWAAAAAASLTGLGSLLAALGSRRKTFEELRSETQASASVKWVDGSLELWVHVPGKTEGRAIADESELVIDLYGPDVPRLVSMMLPVSFRNSFFGSRRVDDIGQDVKSGSDATAYVFSLNVERSSVERELAKLVQQGDRMLVMEIRSADQSGSADSPTVCLVELKPSALLKAYSKPPSSDTAGDLMSHLTKLPEMFLPKPRQAIQQDFDDAERKVTYRHRRAEPSPTSQALRWLLHPSAAVAFLWVLLLRTAEVLAALPPMPGLSALASDETQRLQQMVPALPKNMLEAFDLGYIVAKLEQGPLASTEVPTLLEEAAAILGHDALQQAVTEARLGGIRRELEALAGHRTLLQKTLSLFSFINCLWFAAIIGITVSLGPVLWILSKPVQRFFMQNVWRPIRQAVIRLGSHVVQAVDWLGRHVVLPMVLRLHYGGWCESAVYMLAAVVLAHACRVPPEAGAGVMIAVSALVLLAVGLGYSTMLHGKAVEVWLERTTRQRPALRQVLTSVASLWPVSVLAPLAIMHESRLLGYAATACVLSALGLNAGVGWCCYFIGFDSDDAMLRTAVACGVSLGGMLSARWAGLEPAYLAPFRSAVSVLGGIGHYLAMLLLCNRWTGHWRSDKGKALRANALMVLSLLAAGLGGCWCDVPALTNTATVFGVMWGMDRFLWGLDGRFGWFVVFGGSVGMYYAALFLHANPGYLLSLAEMAY